jgi:hypothetical protein
MSSDSDSRRPLLEPSESVGDEPTHSMPARLSAPLLTLFAVNGITLALPTTALLYIVNTRVEMPLSILPTYAAISFLPFSLKPLYSYLSTAVGRRRDWLIAMLLVLGASSTTITALIPPGNVVFCFSLAFVRSFLSAWPEFLLGVTLLEAAASTAAPGTSFAEAAALFQSQAATARNLGSLLASVIVVLWMLLGGRYLEDWQKSQLLSSQPQPAVLDDRLVTQLLVATSLFHLLGAFVAIWHQVGRQQGCAARSTNVRGTVAMTLDEDVMQQHSAFLPRVPSYGSCPSIDQETLSISEDESAYPQNAMAREDHLVASVEVDSSASRRQSARVAVSCGDGNTRLVVLLQASILLFALRTPFIQATSRAFWDATTTVAVTALTLSVFLVASSERRFLCKSWQRSHRVGLFLILRHAVPNVSFLMSAYMYTVFATTAPDFLAFLSIWDMLTTSLASWSYGKLFVRYSSQATGEMLWLITGTTSVASVSFWAANISLLKILAGHGHHDSVIGGDNSILAWPVVLGTLAVKSLVSVTNEWKFLPDLVVATTAAVDDDDVSRSSSPIGANDAAVGMRYGSMVACIDFGGQLGALLVGPMVTAFGTSRDNNWAHMDELIQLSAVAMSLSAGLVLLLR